MWEALGLANGAARQCHCPVEANARQTNQLLPQHAKESSGCSRASPQALHMVHKLCVNTHPKHEGPSSMPCSTSRTCSGARTASAAATRPSQPPAEAPREPPGPWTPLLPLLPLVVLVVASSVDWIAAERGSWRQLQGYRD